MAQNYLALTKIQFTMLGIQSKIIVPEKKQEKATSLELLACLPLIMDCDVEIQAKQTLSFPQMLWSMFYHSNSKENQGSWPSSLLLQF